MNLERFREKRVLLTGHTGFKGSWLAIWLHELGARVFGYALKPSSDPSNFEVSKVSTLLDGHVERDIRDIDALTATIRDVAPHVIFHLAAQALVRPSYDNPRETFETNVMGTVNVIDGVRKTKHPCTVVVVSSDKCYENREQNAGYVETDAMGGFDPYSASKGCTELVVSSMRRSFFPPERIHQHGVKIASARAGNVIGGGDWAQDRIVADFARAIANGQPVQMRNPHAIRPWQHVLEPLSGYLTLAATMIDSDDARWCDAWNFGPTPGTEVPVRTLVQYVIDAWGSGQAIDAHDPNAPHEAHFLRLSIEKARSQLGWRPRWTVEEAAHRLAIWYKRYYEGDRDMLAACRTDIGDYITG